MPSPGPNPGPLTIARQGSFFIGGRDVHSDTLSHPAGLRTLRHHHRRSDVCALPGARPTPPATLPIVLIHGCCLTGKTWETTPDGRMGWDEYFVRRGYPTYVIDQVWRGRSAADPVRDQRRPRPAKAAPDTLPAVFSAGHEAAWAIFRFGRQYPEVYPGMRFPLAAQGEFWKQMVPDSLAALPTPNPTVPALSALAQRLDGAVLISHSQSGIYPFQTAALNRKGIAALISIEPGACPTATDDMAPYKGLPILVLWGDHVAESPRWAPRLVNCRAFIAAANQAGGQAEMVILPEVGIKGNTHMLMQDDNNLDIADMLVAWIGKHTNQ